MMNKTVNRKFKCNSKNMLLNMFAIVLNACIYLLPNTIVAQQNDHIRKVDKKYHLGIEKTYMAIGARIGDFPCGEAFGISLQDASRYIFSAASQFNATLVPGSDQEILYPEDGIGSNKIFKKSKMSYTESYNRIKNLKIGVTDGIYGERWVINADHLRKNYTSNVFDIQLDGKTETAFDYGNLFHEMLISIQQLSKENRLLKDRIANIEERLNIPEYPRVFNQSDKTNRIEITPNPATKGQIIISYQINKNIKNAELIIMDMNGRTMQTYKLNKANTLLVEEVNLSAGVYTYQLVYDGRILCCQTVLKAQNIYPPESSRSVFMDGGDIQLIKPNTEDWWVKGFLNVDDSLKMISGVGLQGHGDEPKVYFMNISRTPWREPGGIFLLPNGNFGVSKSLPQTKLDVNGPAACDTAFTIGWPNPNYRGIVVDHEENTTWNFMQFKNANGTQILIDGEGNIEAANAKFCEVLVNDDWCDYVFEETYELPSLDDEKFHIKENGHLLGFESEEAMAGEISLVDITKRQQVKIEEMMLHLIELNGKVALLIEENEKLKQSK